jgi:pentatricopeptide repeat protein
MIKTMMLRNIIVVFLFALITGGCATTNTTTSGVKERYTGFLSDYSRLKSGPGKSEAEIYENSSADFSKFDKILLERIRVWYKEDAEYKGIDPTELKALTDYFHQALVGEFEKDYAFVSDPGPDVLRLRIALTEVIPTNTKLTIAVAVTPYASIADFASGKGTGSSPYLGGAAIEMEALDSQTGEQLAAYVERKIGIKYNYTVSPEKAVKSYIDAYTKWGYVKDAMDYWAEMIRTRWDNARKQ